MAQYEQNLNGRLFLEGQFEWTNLGAHSTIIHKIELQRGFLSEYASTEGASDEILAIYGRGALYFWTTTQ